MTPDPRHPPLIDTADALAGLCTRLHGSEWLALDTEFMRERTYYPQLCLVQVANPEQLACVDPLALEDLHPLLELTHDPGHTKVMHAARQDLEVLYLARGELPAPLFDTQIAAALLGFDAQIGYAGLVGELLGHDLPKAFQRADWSRRPLPQGQIDYAADDVRYLRELYPMLIERLEAAGRLEWVQADSAQLLDPALYESPPELAYKRVKRAGLLTPAQQQVVRALADWRERTAQQLDRPRSWICKDEALLELAQAQPVNPRALEAVPGVAPKTVQRRGEAILAAIREGQAQEPVALYHKPVPPTEAEQKRYKALKKQLDAVARELGLQPPVLAARRDLEQLARGDLDSPVLGGWRREVVGEGLLALCQ